jgi:hypothetical protein
MRYPETKIKVLQLSIDIIVSNIEAKYGIAWAFNPSFISSKDRVRLIRYVNSLHDIEERLNNIPHHVTDNCHV